MNALKVAIFALLLTSSIGATAHQKNHYDNLKTIYNRLMITLQTDQSDDGVRIVSRVTAAQQAWIKMRDTTCAVEGIEMLNGSAERLLVDACWDRMTEERVKYLTDLAKTLTGIQY